MIKAKKQPCSSICWRKSKDKTKTKTSSMKTSGSSCIFHADTCECKQTHSYNGSGGGKKKKPPPRDIKSEHKRPPCTSLSPLPLCPSDIARAYEHLQALSSGSSCICSTKTLENDLKQIMSKLKKMKGVPYPCPEDSGPPCDDETTSVKSSKHTKAIKCLAQTGEKTPVKVKNPSRYKGDQTGVISIAEYEKNKKKKKRTKSLNTEVSVPMKEEKGIKKWCSRAKCKKEECVPKTSSRKLKGIPSCSSVESCECKQVKQSSKKEKPPKGPSALGLCPSRLTRTFEHLQDLSSGSSCVCANKALESNLKCIVSKLKKMKRTSSCSTKKKGKAAPCGLSSAPRDGSAMYVKKKLPRQDKSISEEKSSTDKCKINVMNLKQFSTASSCECSQKSTKRGLQSRSREKRSKDKCSKIAVTNLNRSPTTSSCKCSQKSTKRDLQSRSREKRSKDKCKINVMNRNRSLTASSCECSQKSTKRDLQSRSREKRSKDKPNTNAKLKQRPSACCECKQRNNDICLCKESPPRVVRYCYPSGFKMEVKCKKSKYV